MEPFSFRLTPEQSPYHFFFIYTPFPLFLLIILGKQSKLQSSSKKQQPHPILRKVISTMTSIKKLPIRHDLLFQLIKPLNILNNSVFHGHKLSNNARPFPPSNPNSKKYKAANLMGIFAALSLLSVSARPWPFPSLS
jgi:hypothetical protein